MKARFIALTLTVYAVGITHAQETINQLVNTIVDKNPQIMAQHDEVDASQRDLMDENALSNPEVGITHVWGAQPEAGNKFQLDVSQGFDWPGLYHARSRVADSKLELANYEFASARLETAVAAKQLLIDLVHVRQQCALQKQILSDFERMRQAMEKSYEHGLVTILDKKKLEIEIFKLESAMAQTERQVSDVEAQIRAMSPTARLDLTSVNTYPLDPLRGEDEYREDALSLDPSLQASYLRESTSALEAKAARMSRFPGFSVGYEYQHEAGMSYNGFTFGVTLPFFENRNARAAALLRAEAANDQSVAIASELALRTAQDMSQVKMWQGQIDAYNRTIAGGEYLDLLRQAFDGGEITLLTYLDELQYYREATLDYIEAQYNYACSLASLNRYNLITIQ